MEHLDCILVENSYVKVIVIKTEPYTLSDSGAIDKAIELLRGE